MRKSIAVLLLAAVAGISPAVALAVPITVPPSLSPGEQYRLAFRTGARTNALSSDIEFYNAFVTNVANTVPQLAQLGTTWKIIGSTSAVDATENTSTNPSSSVGVSIFRLDGALVASSNADLWDGSIGAEISTFENGEFINPTGAFPSPSVWTGTNADGYSAGIFVLGGSIHASIIGVIGFGGGDDWIVWDSDTKTSLKSVYAISGVLTVVPEPGSMVLALIAAAGFASVTILRVGKRGIRYLARSSARTVRPIPKT